MCLHGTHSQWKRTWWRCRRRLPAGSGFGWQLPQEGQTSGYWDRAAGWRAAGSCRSRPPSCPCIPSPPSLTHIKTRTHIVSAVFMSYFMLSLCLSHMTTFHLRSSGTSPNGDAAATREAADRRRWRDFTSFQKGMLSAASKCLRLYYESIVWAWMLCLFDLLLLFFTRKQLLAVS